MTQKTSTAARIIDNAHRATTAFERTMDRLHFHTDLQDSIAPMVAGLKLSRMWEGQATVVYLTQRSARTGDAARVERLRRSFRGAELAILADHKAKAGA